MSIDTQLTALTRARYNRLAPIYDWLEAFAEAFSFRRWRERLFDISRLCYYLGTPPHMGGDKENH
jgi:hypothetical protein